MSANPNRHAPTPVGRDLWEYRDPYKRCHTNCQHDLARGVLVLDELLDRDGPSPATSTLMQVPPAVARGWILGMFPAPSATRPETMA